jgi:hypothetical protein
VHLLAAGLGPSLMVVPSRWGRPAMDRLERSIVVLQMTSSGRRAETLLERLVFGVERPFSNPRRIRGSRSWNIAIERCRRDTEAVCDLGNADIGIGEQRSRGFKIVLC